MSSINIRNMHWVNISRLSEQEVANIILSISNPSPPPPPAVFDKNLESFNSHNEVQPLGSMFFSESQKKKVKRKASYLVCNVHRRDKTRCPANCNRAAMERMEKRKIYLSSTTTTPIIFPNQLLLQSKQ